MDCHHARSQVLGPKLTAVMNCHRILRRQRNPRWLLTCSQPTVLDPSRRLHSPRSREPCKPHRHQPLASCQSSLVPLNRMIPSIRLPLIVTHWSPFGNSPGWHSKGMLNPGANALTIVDLLPLLYARVMGLTRLLEKCRGRRQRHRLRSQLTLRIHHLAPPGRCCSQPPRMSKSTR